MSLTNDFIWETFDSLFKTVYRQGKRIEAAEARLAQLEQRLSEVTPAKQPDSETGPQE